MSTLTIRIPEAVRVQVAEIAERDGITVEEFISTAAEEKLKARKDFEYLERLASKANRADWDYVMSRVPDRPPLPGDELPEDLRKEFEAK
jgi:hypothetical protein